MKSSTWTLFGVIVFVCGIVFLVAAATSSSLPKEGSYSAGFFALLGFLSLVLAILFGAMGILSSKRR